MFNNLLRYINGYVRMKIYGGNYEKIMNRLASQSIFIWKVCRYSSYIEANISLKDFYMLRSALHGLKKSIRIVKKQGLPFVVKKYKKRKSFLIGMVATYLILLILSSLVWEINIYGTEKIEKSEIIKVLSNSGLELFKPRFMINFEKVKEDLYKNFKNIIWLNLYAKGTSVDIEVVETIAPSEKVDESMPCNIVANKKAIIYNIVTIAGVPKVKAKDVVNPGDLLVSGELEVDLNGEKTKKYVHASANIEGKNYIYISAEQDLEKISKDYTSKTYRDLRFKFNTTNLNIFKSNNQYKLCDKSEKEIKLLPTKGDSKLSYIVTEYKEYKLRVEQYNPEEVKNKLKEKLDKNIADNLSKDAKILDVKVDYFFTENKAIAKGIAVIVEKIGEKKNIENN